MNIDSEIAALRAKAEELKKNEDSIAAFSGTSRVAQSIVTSLSSQLKRLEYKPQYSVRFYEHANFSGKVWAFTMGEAISNMRSGPKALAASSLKISPGAEVLCFTRPGFRGTPIRWSKDVSWFGAHNDKILSAKLDYSGARRAEIIALNVKLANARFELDQLERINTENIQATANQSLQEVLAEIQRLEAYKRSDAFEHSSMELEVTAEAGAQVGSVSVGGVKLNLVNTESDEVAAKWSIVDALHFVAIEAMSGSILQVVIVKETEVESLGTALDDMIHGEDLSDGTLVTVFSRGVVKALYNQSRVQSALQAIGVDTTSEKVERGREDFDYCAVGFKGAALGLAREVFNVGSEGKATLTMSIPRMTRVEGAQVSPLPKENAILAESASDATGRSFAAITVSGVEHIGCSASARKTCWRGINALKIDSFSQAVTTEVFGTHMAEDQSQKLLEWLATLKQGDIFALAVNGDGFSAMSESCIEALTQIGSNLREKLHRSYALVGFRNSSTGRLTAYDEAFETTDALSVEKSTPVAAYHVIEAARTSWKREVPHGTTALALEIASSREGARICYANKLVAASHPLRSFQPVEAGLAMLVMDAVTGKVIEFKRFDTVLNEGLGRVLLSWMKALPWGSLVAVVAPGKAVAALARPGLAALGLIGGIVSRAPPEQRPLKGYAMVGRRGAPVGSAFETWGHEALQQISLAVPLNDSTKMNSSSALLMLQAANSSKHSEGFQTIILKSPNPWTPPHVIVGPEENGPIEGMQNDIVLANMDASDLHVRGVSSINGSTSGEAQRARIEWEKSKFGNDALIVELYTSKTAKHQSRGDGVKIKFSKAGTTEFESSLSSIEPPYTENGISVVLPLEQSRVSDAEPPGDLQPRSIVAESVGDYNGIGAVRITLGEEVLASSTSDQDVVGFLAMARLTTTNGELEHEQLIIDVNTETTASDLTAKLEKISRSSRRGDVIALSFRGVDPILLQTNIFEMLGAMEYQAATEKSSYCIVGVLEELKPMRSLPPAKESLRADACHQQDCELALARAQLWYRPHTDERTVIQVVAGVDKLAVRVGTLIVLGSLEGAAVKHPREGWNVVVLEKHSSTVTGIHRFGFEDQMKLERRLKMIRATELVVLAFRAPAFGLIIPKESLIGAITRLGAEEFAKLPTLSGPFSYGFIGGPGEAGEERIATGEDHEVRLAKSYVQLPANLGGEPPAMDEEGAKNEPFSNETLSLEEVVVSKEAVFGPRYDDNGESQLAQSWGFRCIVACDRPLVLSLTAEDWCSVYVDGGWHSVGPGRLVSVKTTVGDEIHMSVPCNRLEITCPALILASGSSRMRLDLTEISGLKRFVGEALVNSLIDERKNGRAFSAKDEWSENSLQSIQSALRAIQAKHHQENKWSVLEASFVLHVENPTSALYAGLSSFHRLRRGREPTEPHRFRTKIYREGSTAAVREESEGRGRWQYGYRLPLDVESPRLLKAIEDLRSRRTLLRTLAVEARSGSARIFLEVVHEGVKDTLEVQLGRVDSSEKRVFLGHLMDILLGLLNCPFKEYSTIIAKKLGGFVGYDARSLLWRQRLLLSNLWARSRKTLNKLDAAPDSSVGHLSDLGKTTIDHTGLIAERALLTWTVVVQDQPEIFVNVAPNVVWMDELLLQGICSAERPSNLATSPWSSMGMILDSTEMKALDVEDLQSLQLVAMKMSTVNRNTDNAGEAVSNLRGTESIPNWTRKWFLGNDVEEPGPLDAVSSPLTEPRGQYRKEIARDVRELLNLALTQSVTLPGFTEIYKLFFRAGSHTILDGFMMASAILMNCVEKTDTLFDSDESALPRSRSVFEKLSGLDEEGEVESQDPVVMPDAELETIIPSMLRPERLLQASGITRRVASRLHQHLERTMCSLATLDQWNEWSVALEFAAILEIILLAMEGGGELVHARCLLLLPIVWTLTRKAEELGKTIEGS
ncbi:hypothetical protein NDN08_004681 [Rhodosorus marinus]|uniref:Beta/gamma crystallin 'Greek key' domain-containing protein n=1 Tax=Rhodosorus marinus TaxID=101924 RepID=A0AAV8UR45_9RHOD|nr:hypothetical protein NDN08_004681 [Rhodosorus marinus]